jgi:hypothetical protein
MRHSVCGCVVLDAKTKSCGFVLSVTNFEVKKKERKKFPAPHVLKRGGSEASPRNYETNFVKKFCDPSKLGGVFLRFSFEDKLLFFSSN